MRDVRTCCPVVVVTQFSFGSKDRAASRIHLTFLGTKLSVGRRESDSCLMPAPTKDQSGWL